MRRFRSALMVVIAGLGGQLACSGDGIEPGNPFVPEATEPLALTLEVRPFMLRERLPRLDVSTVAGGVRVRVARPDFACTLAQASVGRGPAVLAVVARVGGDPRSLCQGGGVVEYSGTIDDVAPGRYTVHIYEAVADGAPKRLGTRTVTVREP